MPIAGFKTGETVLTPSGKRATVKQVRRIDGRERVTVAYYGVMLADRNFDAAALRKVGHPASAACPPVEDETTETLAYIVRNARLQGSAFIWTNREKAAWQELRRRGEEA